MVKETAATIEMPDFNLDFHIITLMQEVPFFAEISRHVKKVATMTLPTAGVSFDQEQDDIVLYYNPKFFSEITPEQVRNVLVHEFYHLVFCHLTSRRKTPHKAWNIATDCAINSLIVSTRGDKSGVPLPPGCCIPGEWPTHPEGRELTAEEKEAGTLAHVLANLPKLECSEFYYSELMKQAQQQMQSQCSVCGGTGKCNKSDAGKGTSSDGEEPGEKGAAKGESTTGSGNCTGETDGDSGSGEGEGPCPACSGSFDDHSGWDNIPDNAREYVEGRVKNVVEKAVKAADQCSNGWGTIPQEIREAIRASVASVINWRAVLRQFIGSTIRGGRTTSIKRISRRYPYIHPGLKRSYQAKLLIAVDQSSSVGNEMIAEFFGELSTLVKKVDISVVYFDTECGEVNEWRRGQAPKPIRARAGGTDFNAPTALINDPKNRGRWDGLLIMSDGECSKPVPSKVKRGWIIGKDRKLLFDTDEIQIKLGDKPVTKGTWR